MRHLDELGQDMQLFLAGLETFRPDDYVDAQRIREALRAELADVLRQVDVLALPATAVSAPPVTDTEARTGFIDPPLLDAMCRFQPERLSGRHWIAGSSATRFQEVEAHSHLSKCSNGAPKD